MQISPSLRRVVLSSVACLTVQHFFTFYHFRKTIIEHRCVLIFSVALSATFITLRIIQCDITINVHRSYVKCPLLSDFHETWMFSTNFRKILKYQMWQSDLWGPCSSMRTGGRAHITKLTVALRNFANVPTYYPKEHTGGAMCFLWYIKRIYKWILCLFQLGFPHQNFAFTWNTYMLK
jgi:hypothetical protein